MPLVIQPITESHAHAASAWRYPDPYAIYDHESVGFQEVSRFTSQGDEPRELAAVEFESKRRGAGDPRGR
jgi:hypothetical protein